MEASQRYLFLVRHGATDENLAMPYRLQGQRVDPPLNELGRRQAERAAAVLQGRPLAVAYSSPLQRARQTAEILASPHGLPVRVVDELIECDVGKWEGMSWEQVRQRYPEAFGRFMADPARFPYLAGESFQDVHDRAMPKLRELVAQHEAGDLLVVTHNIVGRVLLAGVLGLPLRNARALKLDNCGISVLAIDGSNTLSVQTINSAFHLCELHMPNV